MNCIFSKPKFVVKLDKSTFTEEEEESIKSCHGYYSSSKNIIYVREDILYDKSEGIPCLFHELGHYLDKVMFEFYGGGDFIRTSKTSIKCKFLRIALNDILVDNEL